MKAVICPSYGPPEVLVIKEINNPVPQKKEVLVKIIASAVNTGDVRIRGLKVEGFMKVIMRLVLGFTKPRKPILGTVFSGIVEQVGAEATKFKVGDEVYGTTGFKQGCHAEFLCIPEKKVITYKPRNASFEEAAALPFGGQTAIYFLRKGKITEIKNPKVLIYGATGSVGTAAVQIAKHYGAVVTAVCSSKGEELTQTLGADNIILYDKEDFTEASDKFDIIFDTVGKTSKKQCASLLKPEGKFISVEGADIASERAENLEFLSQLYENKTYISIIDKKGNVVLSIAP